MTALQLAAIEALIDIIADVEMPPVHAGKINDAVEAVRAAIDGKPTRPAKPASDCKCGHGEECAPNNCDLMGGMQE